MPLNALQRLRLTSADTTASVSDSDIEVTAQFDSEKDHELRTLQQTLRRKNVVFRLDMHHLFHKSNMNDIDMEIQIILEILDSLGHSPRILPGTLKNNRFAIKCTHGLVLQRIDFNLRIFFSI